MCTSFPTSDYSQEAIDRINAEARPASNAAHCSGRTSEQIMVDMIRADLGVVIDPHAWRMFVRHRFDRISPLAHRIHEGKR